MATGLAQLDLDRFGGMLAACFPGACLAIHGAAHKVLWRNDATGPALHVAIRASSAALHLRDRNLRQTQLDDGSTMFEQPLTHAIDGALGSLVLVAPAGFRRDNVAAQLAAAGMCLEQLASQEGELAEMAEELGARYEELNLLYTLDEVGSGYDPAHGRAALQRMTADVGAFLGVGMVGVYSPAEGLDICIPHEEASSSLAAMWPELRARVLGFVAERDGGVTVNDRNDRLRVALLGDLRVKLLAVPLRDLQGRVSGLLCLVNEPARANFSNSDRKLLEVLGEQASRVIQASYDDVTGLLNRHGFGLRAAELLTGEATRPLSLMYLNLDGFRLVNDSAGRSAGDSLLRRLAALLRASQPRDGVVAHLGGDEFVVLFAASEDAEQVHRAAAMLQGALAAQGFVFDGKRFDSSVCVGIAHGDGDAGLLSALLLCAEAACRVAKRYGRGQLRVFDAGNDEYVEQQRQAEWGPRITEALVSNQFVLYAQPIVPLAGGLVSHHEVLLRLREPDGRIVAPGSFIPAAERYGLMPRVDRMVLEGTLDFLSRAAQRPNADKLVMAVNVSGQSLVDSEFLGFVIEAVEAVGVPFSQLCFEVTETVAVADFDAAVRFIESLRKRGSRVALDDFGSGLSSFGYLRRLPVDYLKIDGQIVRDMVSDPVNAAMVEAIHRIGAEMCLKTIAEFVENDEIADALRRIGVDYAQGYGFGRPAPLEQLLDPHCEPLPLVVGVAG